MSDSMSEGSYSDDGSVEGGYGDMLVAVQDLSSGVTAIVSLLAVIAKSLNPKNAKAVDEIVEQHQANIGAGDEAD